jgi:molybdenum cofactor cytidylyltransferase
MRAQSIENSSLMSASIAGSMSMPYSVLPQSAVIVLLAAGESRRYGGIKQLADIGGEPMVRRAARAALDTGANVIVVTGSHAAAITTALADLQLLVTHHADWQEGMGSSLAAGIRHLHDRFPSASGAMLWLADQPLLGTVWLSRLLKRHDEKPELILATEQAGVAGPPVVFPRDCFDDLMHWSGNQGAHALLKREASRVERFPCDIGMDVDTPEDLTRALDWLTTNRLD